MDAYAQAKSLIEKSRDILILPPKDIDGDSLGSALALFFILRKMGKNASAQIEKVPEKFRFLTELPSDSSQNFVINIDGSEKEISEMRYEKNNKGLKIYLTLSRGGISKQDVSFSAFSQNPDLVITVGLASLEEAGHYEAPILNIDNQPQNENFGEVNLTETTSSLSEIITNLIRTTEENENESENKFSLFDENIATCLLAGVVYASQNFRHPKTRSKTFEISSFLISQGGNHQKIVQHLYKQKNISQIKLLGKILEKMNLNEEKELSYAFLTERDFRDCQASSRDLGFVVDELKFNFRYLPNLLILWESHASPVLIKGIFYSPKANLIKKILENFEGTSRGEGVLFLTRELDINSAQEKILKII